MSRWILIGFGIVALTTGFVVYMAAKNSPLVLPESVPPAAPDVMAGPGSSGQDEQQNPASSLATEPAPVIQGETISNASTSATQWKTRDASEYVRDSSEKANAVTPATGGPASPVTGNKERESGSNLPVQEQSSGVASLPGTPNSDPANPVNQIVPTYSDPMTEIGGSQPIGLLPGEGEPPYTGPLPGEGEPDYVGPLPGENEPPYTGPLPGENELPATGPLPGEEGTP